MIRRKKWTNFLITVALMLSLIPTGGEHAAYATEPPAPLPRNCAGITPPGETPPACCIYGYVYYGDAPVAGASVRIASSHGVLTATTASGGASGHPYYQADLSSTPLSVSAGETITITASYSGMVSTRTWTTQGGAQQVDVGLVAGYQATGPLSAPRGALDLLAPTTDVSGIINTDTTWTLAGSPYIVTGNVLVQSGVRLTIEPGVQVRFNAGRSFQINGELIARGTNDSPITFTSNAGASPGAWGYIYFADSSVDATYDAGGNYVSGSIIQYAIIEYAGGASVSENGALRIDASSPFIDHTTIRYSASNGIRAINNGAPKMIYNTIVDNAGSGIWVSGNETVEIGYNTISRNSSSNSGGGILVEGGTSIIRNNVISDNSAFFTYYGGGGGICTQASNTTISDNLIANNSVACSPCWEDGSSVYVTGGTGIYSLVTIRGNTIVTNTTTGVLVSAAGGSVGAAELSGNVISNNEGAGIKCESHSTITASGNLIAHNEGQGLVILSYAPTVYVHSNLVVENSETGVLVTNPSGTATLSNNVIADNTASPDNGGAYVAGGITLSGNSILRNRAGNNAALYYSGNGDFINNTILGNTTTGVGNTRAMYVLGHPTCNANNIYNNTGYALYNANAQGTANLDAKNNWWGTTSDPTIQALIYDWSDDSNLGLVDYIPYRTSHNTAAPISPPTDLTATLAGASINMRWLPNPESDLAGYKVYWDTDSGYPYANSVNVGNVTAYTITGVITGTRYYVTVTAYDTTADGVNDWTDGNESWFAEERMVQKWTAPQADFTAAPLSGSAPLTVTFTDQSTGDITAWSWAFGDGGTSIQQHPTHVYTVPGSYTVTLTVNGPGGSDTETRVNYITVGYAPPIAAFTGSPLSGTAPLTVTFTDQSTGDITAWSWAFGDGGTSTQQHPTHVYTVPGSYTVTLTVNGPGGSDTETRVNYITVGYVPPVAAFTGSPLSGTAPLTVTFTDQSTGDIIAWSWAFGDGGISGARHPAHVYEAAGSYAVTLSVIGPGGSDTETKPGYITVSAPGFAPPTAIIDAITPNLAIQGQDTIIFNGSGHDNDEGGAYLVAYQWLSSLDGVLSTQEDFTVQASELTTGTHTITFRVQDDEGVWSPEVTRTLTVQATQADVRTLILANRQKLAALYSESEATQVMSKLNALAAHAAVKGLVVQLENDAAVAAAYAAWDAAPTSTSKANAVTAAIRNVVLAQWAAHPNLEYLVIVGDDRAIPFHRVLDQTRYPESTYPYISASSTTGAALRDNMTLTDDYYADKIPTVPGGSGWDGHDLYIPDLGIGRLIETPTEIIAQIDAFLVSSEVTAANGIVTGYDFVQDGAQAICSRLNGDGLATNCTLIGTSWNATQFKSNVLNARHDVVSINGHANHYTMGTPSGSVYSSDVATATANHAQALFYTLGCHSGLNVPPNNSTWPLDLPQAFVGRKAYYIANTGYGWGYVTAVGLSEQLMLDFTERLVYGSSASVGQALAAAKQEYYLNERDFDYYDEKILIESTLYGLPMLRYSTPTAAGLRLQAQAQEATVVKEEQITRLPNGLTVNSISYQFPALLAESTDDGLYYTFAGLVHTGDGEPIQPKYTADLSFPQTQAHGVVFRGGAYTDVISFNPVVDRAITETATLAEPTFNAPGWYPPLLHRLNRLERGDNLVTLLGQFNPQSQTERLYDRLSFDVYYHTGSSDWTPPEIISMSSGVTGGSTLISVGAKDVSGIQAVVIAYTDGKGIWSSISLTESGGKWSGSFPANSTSVFIIQVVDKAGNVVVNDNGGRYFRPGDNLFAIYLPLILR